jgi:Tol biopolymer transport system component
MNKRKLTWIAVLILILACKVSSTSSSPPSNLLATLSASTPLSGKPIATADSTRTPFSPLLLFTPTPSILIVPTSASAGQPMGHIVFTCQIFKVEAGNQICIMNADGSGFRRLTTDDTRQHFYPSLAPDGRSVVYSAYREDNVYEIYEMDIAGGNVVQLTNRLGILNAPEISPDGKSIVFKQSSGFNNRNKIWIMDRDGQNVTNLPKVDGWDPTWSADGKYFLFASAMNGTVQLYTIRVDGSSLHRITNLPAIRGRSDWSPDGKYIVTYSGEPWKREVYIMNADGSNVHVISPAGGNSQGPAFSPDGQWIVFTAYYDHLNDDNGCEIYIMRLDGTDLRRLTNNDYCDYQPRWGP